METAVAVGGCILGVVFCLCGYAVRRLWAACGGVLLGVAIGSYAGLYLQDAMAMILLGALFAGALAFVGYRFPAAGVPMAAGVTGFGAGLLVLYCFGGGLWPFALIGAAAGLAGALLAPRKGPLFCMALSGALLLTLSLFGLFTGRYWFVYEANSPFASGETAVFLLFSSLLVTAVGIAVQTALLHRREAVDRGTGLPPPTEDLSRGQRRGKAKKRRAKY